MLIENSINSQDLNNLKIKFVKDKRFLDRLLAKKDLIQISINKLKNLVFINVYFAKLN